MHYYDKTLPEESHGTSEFGTYVHMILEKWNKGELQLSELLDYYIDHYWENISSDFTMYMTENFYKDFSENYYNKGLEFFQNFEGFDFDVVDAEQDFDLVYENKFRINGRIDLIAKYKDQDGLIVVDYKSKGNWKSKAERLEYEKQLYFYAYAVKQLYGEYPKKMAFFMFRINKWTWVDFDLDRLNEVMDWAEDRINTIQSEFMFAPILEENNNQFDWFCYNFCGIRHSCKYKCQD
jgi:ATP-dependent exoDNAse (exonuclease V) beta subunit